MVLLPQHGGFLQHKGEKLQPRIPEGKPFCLSDPGLPQHSHAEPNHSLVGPGLGTAGCRLAALAPAHQRPVSASTPNRDNQKCLQTLPKIPF